MLKLSERRVQHGNKLGLWSWRRSRGLAAFVVAIAALVIAVPVLANAGPPASELWLTFVNESGNELSLEGLQLYACATSACDAPQRVYTYGRCDRPDCFAASPELAEEGELDCEGMRCLLTTHATSPRYFGLIAQFDEGIRRIEPMTGFPTSYGTTHAWRLRVSDDDLMGVEPDPAFQAPGQRYRHWLQALVLTLTVELIVAGAYVLIRKPGNTTALLRIGAVVLLANLLTYPLVWLWLPSLSRFQPAGARRTGLAATILALIYLVIVAALRRAKGRWRRIGLVLVAVSVPVAVVALLLYGAIVAAYRFPDIAVPGPSWMTMVVIAEVVAVVAEALLLTLFTRRRFPAWALWLVSLLMNGASYLVGLAVFPG